MKKLFMIFGVLFLLQSELFAEEKQSTAGVISTVYSQLTQTSAQLTGQIDGSIFGAMQSIFFNSLAFSLIGLILVFWLFKHLKGGGFSRDDLFKGGTWLITVACIYGIMSSYNAYAEFKSWFLIPQHILKAVISSFSGGQSAGGMLDSLVSKIIDVWYKAHQIGVKEYTEDAWFFDDEDSLWNTVPAGFAIIVWWITIGLYTLIAVGIFIMQIMSNFALSIFGCFAPMVIILLLIPQTRGYFFSWLKNYVAISFYIPMTMLPLMVLDKGMGLMNLTADSLWNNTFSQFAMSLVLGALAIYILTKIPEWINTILGTQESGAGFTAATAQSMISGAGTAAKVGVSSGLSSTAMLAKGTSATARFGMGLKDGFKGVGKVGASNARKSGTKTAEKIKAGAGKIKNGFKAASTFFSR